MKTDFNKNTKYSSDDYPQKVNTNVSDKKRVVILKNRFVHLKRELTVNFDKPFSVRDQFVIMIVILLISSGLFSVVYLVSMFTVPNRYGQSAVTEVSHITDNTITDERTVNDSLSVVDASQPTSNISQSSEHSEPSEIFTPSEQKPNVKDEISTEASDSSSEETSDAPEQSEQTIYPEYFGKTETLNLDNRQIHYGALILVNKDCSCRFDGENLSSLIDSPDRKYDITDENVSLDSSIIPDFDSMMSDFYDIYGDTDIMVACGYRSMAMQAKLYQDEIDEIGEEAKKWVAQPGFSEHQTGLALDLNLNIPGNGSILYESVEPYSWLNENCYRYGFIVRYPEGKEDITGYSYEAWHFRYVGIPSAYYIAQNELTFEEYLDILKTKNIGDPLYVSTLQGDYALYYISASDFGSTDLSVPADLSYTVSGDNYSGFIVTAKL